MIEAITPDNLKSYVGIYRNGAWEATQILGNTPPGSATGTYFPLGTGRITAANSGGQFLFESSIIGESLP